MDQKKLLDKFKQRVIDRLPHEYMKKEIYLIKWLRSSDFQLDTAEDRLIRNLRWRQEQRMDTIHTEDFSDMWKNDFRYYTEGRDKLGRPFVLVEIKDMDPRRFIIQGKGERLVRYLDKGFDEVCGLVRELGEKWNNMTRVNVLVNADGFNVVQHACIPCIPIMLRHIFSFVEHFPECADKFIFVNCPRTVEQILSIGKAVVTEEMQNSIFIYGKDKKIWMQGLSQDFDKDQLPPSLGGIKIYKGMQLDD
ncbi:protein real-time isoform X2 [Folsomia candida]|uniref:Protein real-time n=2 Tax=Folsomia candida TaxID=158441 RepID=A0A226F672_FOLCA|nr:protein real-time isoform X2 [Folsomia candida]OXA64701.1 Protein real-time [Folsomia candida]